MAEMLNEEEIKYDLRLKKIDVLNAQIIACQEESKSYNNSYISSTVVCALFAAVGAFLSKSESLSNELAILLYFIPIIYLWMVFNIIKYTGFQVQLGTYRHELEIEVNKLLGKKEIYLMESKTNNRLFFAVSGLGIVLFVVPPLILFAILFSVVGDIHGISKLFDFICGAELVACIVEALAVLKSVLDERKHFPEDGLSEIKELDKEDTKEDTKDESKESSKEENKNKKTETKKSNNKKRRKQ